MLKNELGRSIRVLHIIESLRAGGKERQLLELLSGMAEDPDIHTELAVMSNEVHYDKVLEREWYRLERRSRRDPSILWRLDKLVRNARPDIIHSWGSMCTVYAAPIALLHGVSLLNGQIRDARIGLTLRDADYRRARITLPFSDVVVANSKAGLEAYHIQAERGACIYNGFDLSRLTHVRDPNAMRQELGIGTSYVVGMVATFSALKDYATFFEAARTIINERADVTFVAVGDGPELPTFRRKFARIPSVDPLRIAQTIVVWGRPSSDIDLAISRILRETLQCLPACIQEPPA